MAMTYGAGDVVASNNDETFPASQTIDMEGPDTISVNGDLSTAATINMNYTGDAFTYDYDNVLAVSGKLQNSTSPSRSSLA